MKKKQINLKKLELGKVTISNLQSSYLTGGAAITDTKCTVCRSICIGCDAPTFKPPCVSITKPGSIIP